MTAAISSLSKENNVRHDGNAKPTWGFPPCAPAESNPFFIDLSEFAGRLGTFY
jgi:hypothetical protein